MLRKIAICETDNEIALRLENEPGGVQCGGSSWWPRQCEAPKHRRRKATEARTR